MDRLRIPIVQKFSSFEDADRADDKYYAAMSEIEKLKEFLLILQTFRPNNGKVERIASTYPLCPTVTGDEKARPSQEDDLNDRRDS
jgi:hypothetical protein